MSLQENEKKSDIFFIRHLKDRNVLSGSYNDAPLEAGQDECAERSASQILERMKHSGLQRLELITSPKKRTRETAAMVRDFLVGSREYSLDVTLTVDERTRELDQGKYILPIDYQEGDYFAPLQDAWKAYFYNTFSSEQPDLSYRFGDPVVVGNLVRHPELVGYFESFGENQTEFSLRYMSFLIDLLEKIKKNQDLQIAIVGHQAILARLLEFYSLTEVILSSRELFSVFSFTLLHAGTFAALEWVQLKRENIKKMVSELGKPGMTLFVDFSQTSLLTEYITLERELLQARYMQDWR